MLPRTDEASNGASSKIMCPPRHERSSSEASTGSTGSTAPSSPGSSSSSSSSASAASPLRKHVGYCSDEDTSCGSNGPERARSRFHFQATPRFVVFAMVLAASTAFAVGTVSRVVLLAKVASQQGSSHCPVALKNEVRTAQKQLQLPSPTVLGGKDVPFTTFASKTFHREAASASHSVHLDRRNADAEAGAVATSSPDEEGDDSDDEDRNVFEESLHLPAGQHLLVDIKGVDPRFLDDENLLARAMVDLTTETGLTLLSYHCHNLVPVGVSCAGVLLESHVAFHTWPQDGAIAMDLFTCGAEPLIPVLPVIEKLFAVPSSEAAEDAPEPSMVWSHTLRGFREGFSPDYNVGENPFESDMGTNMLNKHTFEHKVPLVSDETDFQHVDIYELIHPRARSLASYQKSLEGDGSYEAMNPELFRPNKHLYLDGVEQSSLYGEAAYHEALVHPAMLAHPGPKRVAIIGGGEGATLREILKHKTVEEVVMVEIDQELVEICKEHLPEWADCTDNAGSDADSCFDDGRASVYFEDAFAWFIDRFGSGASGDEEKFDVIIMDALDPQRMVEIVGNLYKDNQFIYSLFNGLSDDGVFVVQMGETDESDEQALELGLDKQVAELINTLESLFQSMHIYDEGHSNFDAPWAYMVSLKNSNSRELWYRTPAEVEIELHKRLHETKSGNPPLFFFDGATMSTYQSPSKAHESRFCKREDKPWGCEAYSDTSGQNLSAKAFHAWPSTYSVLENTVKKTQGNEVDLSNLVAFTQEHIPGQSLGNALNKANATFNPLVERHLLRHL